MRALYFIAERGKGSVGPGPPGWTDATRPDRSDGPGRGRPDRFDCGRLGPAWRDRHGRLGPPARGRARVAHPARLSLAVQAALL